MAKKPLLVLALSFALTADFMTSHDESAAQPASSQQMPTAIPQQSQQGPTPVAVARDSEIAQLRREVEATERILDQMQKVDNKVADIAPWIAASIAVVALFPILLVGYEWSFRRISEKRFEDFKADVARSVEFAKSDIERTANDKINDRVDFIIMSELRRLTQNIESDYSRNLAQVENICYSFLQNEFLQKCGSNNAKIPSAIGYLYIFRHLLVLLVAGNGRERLTALHRISEEYVGECGPNTKSFFAALLSNLESDSRFARQDVARALEVLKQHCA